MGLKGLGHFWDHGGSDTCPHDVVIDYSDKPGRLQTQSVTQKLALLGRVELEMGPGIGVKVACPRQDYQLLRFYCPGICLQGEISRGQDILLRNDHQQWSRRDVLDLMRGVIGSKCLDTPYGRFVLPFGFLRPVVEEDVAIRCRESGGFHWILVDNWDHTRRFASGACMAICLEGFIEAGDEIGADETVKVLPSINARDLRGRYQSNMQIARKYGQWSPPG